MAYITLRTARSGVVSGIRFVDGKAEAVLGPNTRKFFEASGATISEENPEDVPNIRWTKPRLIAYATEHGVEVPDGTKQEILEAIQAALE